MGATVGANGKIGSRKTLTTGMVARVLEVSAHSVCNLMRAGALEGYRLTPRGPGPGDRRILRASLVRYMREHGIPLSLLDGGARHRVLLAGCDGRTQKAVADGLPDGGECQIADTLFSCGRLVESFAPTVLVLDFVLGRSSCLDVARELAAAKIACRVVGLAWEDEAEAAALESTGGHFARVLVRPFDPAILGESVRALLVRRESR